MGFFILLVGIIAWGSRVEAGFECTYTGWKDRRWRSGWFGLAPGGGGTPPMQCQPISVSALQRVNTLWHKHAQHGARTPCQGRPLTQSHCACRPRRRWGAGVPQCHPRWHGRRLLQQGSASPQRVFERGGESQESSEVERDYWEVRGARAGATRAAAAWFEAASPVYCSSKGWEEGCAAAARAHARTHTPRH